MQSQHESEATAQDRPSSNRPQYPTVQHAGPVWRRRPAHKVSDRRSMCVCSILMCSCGVGKGGNFVMAYAVLKKGHIEIYESKDIYEQGEDMKQRVKLQDLRLTVKLKEFHHDYSSYNLVSD